MILLTVSIVACLFAQAIGVIPYPNLDDDTNCPIGVDHACTGFCAEDQNRYGCYCDLTNGDSIVTASIFTPCPSDAVDPCTSAPCLNGGTCAREGLSNYKCDCASGFGGKRCEVTLPKCSDADIQCPNGECVETTNPAMPVYCQCYDGVQRDPTKNQTCPANPCFELGTSTSICQNGGKCKIVSNVPVCDCAAGYAGNNCTKPLKTPYCQDRPGVCGVGTCQQSLTPPFYSCNCGNYPSTFGKTIMELTKCEESGCYSANPCLNGGTCSNKANGGFLCQCSTRYAGTKCEKQSVCYTNPCLNQGVCEVFNDTTFYCNCPKYYTGIRCETKLQNPCLTVNCGPYGVCEDNEGVPGCRCADGLNPANSPCQDPCINKNCGTGVCTRRANATHEAVCSCPVDRQGDACEIPRDPCREAPRCGGGYCKPNYAALRGYNCVCEGGTVSPNPCPFSQTCPIKDCGAQGICVETDGLIPKGATRPIFYVCLCQKGYISSGSCDTLLPAGVAAVQARCGPNGKAYPSRNPNNPVGCWCNNGTHIEEIEDDGPAEYCP